MAKRKRLEKKKRVVVRERNWEEQPEADFSHDLARHRRALAKLPEHSLYHHTLSDDFMSNATVVNHARKWAFVRCDDMGADASETQLCLIDESLQEGDETLLAPGDRVLVERDVDGNHVVRGVAERKTMLVRFAPRRRGVEKQVIAANVDALLIVAAAAQPPFRPGLIDRFLIAAQMGGVEPVLCVNKMDLVDREPEQLSLYRELGLTVCLTSCNIGQGINTLRDVLIAKTSVFAGHSGVGKSSILNALDTGLRVFTREISEATQRGKHATTAARLYELAGNIRVIDTPGIRTLGLWNVTPEEVALYFPDIAEHGVRCRFRNCTHVHEPGCAVLDAIESGSLAQARYASYRRIRENLESETK